MTFSAAKRGSMSTAGLKEALSFAFLFICIATLGMMAQGSERSASFTAAPFSVRTTTRPAAERGRSIHVEQSIPPYFSTDRRA